MNSLAHHLRLAAGRISQVQAAALSPHGVTVAEWTVLHALYDAGAVAPSALAEACGLTRGAVTKLVDRLRAKRLVVRAAAGREDRRYQTIALTGAGATLVPVLAGVVAEVEARVFAHLSAGQREAITQLCVAQRPGGPRNTSGVTDGETAARAPARTAVP